MSVRLVTRDRRLVKLVTEHLKGEPCGGIQHETPEWLNRPRTASYVVTTRELCAEVERFAVGVGAMPVVLPEALPFLAQKAVLAHQLGNVLILLGFDYGKAGD